MNRQTTTDSLYASFWDGATWSAPDVVATGAIPGTPAVGQAGGKTVVVWAQMTDVTGGEQSLYKSNYDGAWSAPSLLAPQAAPVAMAATLAAADSAAVGVAPDGLFVLAWVDQTRLLVTMWDGVSWTEPAQIAAAGAIANLLVGRMDGKLAVSWDQDIDADPNVVILGRMASTYSGYWSEPEPPTREVSSSPGISAAVNAVRSNILVGSGDFLELLASCPNRDGLWAAMGIGSPPKDPCCEKKKDEPPEDEEKEEPPPPPPVCEYPGDCPEPPPDDPPDTPLPPGTPRPPLPRCRRTPRGRRTTTMSPRLSGPRTPTTSWGRRALGMSGG